MDDFVKAAKLVTLASSRLFAGVPTVLDMPKRASHPNLKFVSFCSNFYTNFRFKCGTSNILILVRHHKTVPANGLLWNSLLDCRQTVFRELQRRSKCLIQSLNGAGSDKRDDI